MKEELVEMLGMRLANRAYVYRILHIVFGAEPSGDELRALGCAEAVEALRFAGDVAADEGADALYDAARLLEEFGAHVDDASYAASLKSQFTRLFLVPGDSCVHPWESPYIGKEVMLFQESTLDVRHRYREHGFVAMEFGHFPEDHVSMMLDFLGHLSSRAFEAFGDGCDDEVRRILASQEDFVAAHLLNWLPAFREQLALKDDGGAYRRFADALQAFLELDVRFMRDVQQQIAGEE